MRISKVRRTKKKIIAEPSAGEMLQFSESAANDTGTPAKKKRKAK